MTSNERITTVGTALAAPIITPDRVAEFPLRDALSDREYLVRIPAHRMPAAIDAGAEVRIDGEAGWTIPGRSWRHEASRTVLQAASVDAAELALAA
jgi:hypothetical protein